jgi:hypothetical protein
MFVQRINTDLQGPDQSREEIDLGAGTDVMIFKIFSPKNLAKKLAFLTQNKDKLCKILIITLVFEKSANFVKLSKIAENCDHNIDPRSQLKYCLQKIGPNCQRFKCIVCVLQNDKLRYCLKNILKVLTLVKVKYLKNADARQS